MGRQGEREHSEHLGSLFALAISTDLPGLGFAEMTVLKDPLILPLEGLDDTHRDSSFRTE